jgi:SAM-dependent methyltransferase
MKSRSAQHAITAEPISAGPAADITAAGCPVCSAQRTKFLFTKNGHRVFRCAICSLEFLHPQPGDDTLAAIYSSEYFFGDQDPESNERVAKLKSATASHYLDCIAGRLATGQGRMLEIGCGTGELLVRARARGFEVRGVEFSPPAVAVANRRLQAALVETGTIETANVPSHYFDVVVACDVIEHVRDPRSFLVRVYDCLRPGGLVFLVTPCPDSWSRKLMGRYWMEYKTEHLFYLSKASLTHLLADTRFESANFAPNRKVLSVDYLDRHFRRFPVPVCTSLLRAVRRILPGSLAHRHFTVAASGVMVVARKPAEQVL